jgi:predicted nucleotidyltransferase
LRPHDNPVKIIGRYHKELARETMKNLEEVRALLEEHKEELKNRYGVSRIGIFGSYARNEQIEESDVDILVEFERPIGLDFVALADHLEAVLGFKVDLVSRGAIKPNRWKYVAEDLLYV